ncbi:hypothetical protein OG801_25535 [Nocardioides sp. NBC_00163]|uniref:trypco2 family protein n=1 Tax=Nocardioides sp. NBC_00163 TaxID=2975999 RepID=UPI00324D9909
MDGIGLSQAIETLRQELSDAQASGREGELRFELGTVDLELSVAMTKDANGKVGWRILEAGGSIGTERTQTIRLSLKPLPSGAASAQENMGGIIIAGETSPSRDGHAPEHVVPMIDTAEEAE